jgi:hypothetical protein
VLLLFVCIAGAAYLFASIVVIMLGMHTVRLMLDMLQYSTNNKHTQQVHHDADV